jgi:predicted enzyme related to lactoylglutathione lyase
MRVTRVIADLTVADIGAASDFYRGYLGLDGGGMDLGWVASFESADGTVRVHLVTEDATAPENPAISVAVGDGVEEAYAEAQRRGYEIVHPLTQEPWGVRRFFVRAPDGTVVNVVSHRDE